MKRFGIAIEVGRPKAMKRKIKATDKSEMAEALANVIDKNLVDATFAAGRSLDSYVDSLNHIWGFTDRGDYDIAMEMMYVLAMALDHDSKVIMEFIIMRDAELTEAFLDYFGEYITDGYIIDRIIARSQAVEDSLEDVDDDEEKQEVYDIHYEEVKEFFKEGEDNE